MLPRLLPLVWLWLGATLLFTAVVAPAVFAVLPTRALAGLVVGRVLPVLFWSGALVGLVLAVGSDGWRRVAALVLVAATLGAQLGVAPRIERARAALGPSVEDVPSDDPRRAAFGRLHGISVLLLGIGMLGALAIAVGGVRGSGVPTRTDPHDASPVAVPRHPTSSPL
jgi:hypothetical protein